MTRISHSKKIQHLIKTANTLFTKHGVHRITIEEICQESGVSKMTFYKFFKNKLNLVEFIIIDAFERERETQRKIMAKSIPFPEKIKELLEEKHKSTTPVSPEFFNDIWKNPLPGIKTLIKHLSEQSINELTNAFIAAREKGEIRRNINPQFIMYILNQISQMLKDETLIKIYDTPNGAQMELANFFFYGILPGEYQVK